MHSNHPSPSETWLITGAAGFIGSNLATYLLDRGHKVVGIDNFKTGTQANVDRIVAGGETRFNLIEGDIRDKKVLAAAMPGVDTAVHLAAQVSVPHSIDDPVHNQSVNDAGFLSTLLEAADTGVANFVFASSCALYGDNQSLPLKESETPMPLSPYAVTKLNNEIYANLLRPQLNEMIAVGLRFFNVFGPWQSADGGYASVIPRWIQRCRNNEQPEVFGDGSATRDFCFVGDVCRAIEIAGNLASQPDPIVYNVGSGVQTDLASLFSVIRSVLLENGHNVDFESPLMKEMRPGDILHSCADTSLAADKLGFRAETSLVDGLREMVSRDSKGGLEPAPRSNTTGGQ